MLKRLSIPRNEPGQKVITVWITMILVFFVAMTVVIFPVMTFGSAPEASSVFGVNGYAALPGGDEDDKATIFTLQGEWEFYPNQLYSFDDFTNGRTGEHRTVSFPHYWRDESSDIIGKVGYATYRMRVRIPPSFSGVGIYSRFQYSAYEIFLNDTRICGAGVINEDFALHVPVYLASNGYTSYAIGVEGRTLSVIVHVQNNINDRSGLINNIYIGSESAVKSLRTILLTVNGLISGGLMLLFTCILLIYLSGMERKEYLDYTIVSLIGLFLSLTNGGENLMYSIGIDTVLLARLEYCALITGSFFANYRTLKRLNKIKPVFYSIHAYIAIANAVFLLAPLPVVSQVKWPIIAIAGALFILPLVNSIINVIKKPGFNTAVSLVSCATVFTGICMFMFSKMPWDSVDVLSISIMIHCVLQMLIFLRRYRKTEKSLKDMTETLEERIAQRTVELTRMKETAESATVAKSNFLATMSHEIRTPMNAIMGISDLMRTDNLDDVQLGYLTNIKKSAKALLQIINDILDFSKIEAGKLEVLPVHFNLMAMYDNICSLCRFTADAKGLDFKYSFAQDVPHYICGDEVRYRQVILNIINNAIKYTKDGYVDFKVERTELEGVQFLKFIVRDTGIGIKQEDFPRVFDAFEQLDSASNRKIVGTGLGLSITKLLVKLMDGDILLTSEYGSGSTFTILLPLVEGDETLVSRSEAYVPVIASGARVLVVDDNQINLTVASGFLAVHNIHPDTASSGREAIEMIKSYKYDLVFMDHMMPEMDGIEATRQIREIDGGIFNELPIIALTANAVTGATAVFKEAGMNDFLSKPIDAAQMNTVLIRWLPDEKISIGAAEEQSNGELDEYHDAFIDLSRIDGLDVTAGLANVAGNKTVYLSILRQYCNELNDSVAEIAMCLVGEDWANYTIKLHALKGVFANLGVSGLSKKAYRLETASRNGEYALCRGETEQFCEKMEVFRDALVKTRLPEAKKQTEKTEISAEELRQKLTELSNNCMLGDSDSAEEIQKELSVRRYSNEIDRELEDIFGLLASFDFELVADRINQLVPRI